MWKRLITMGLVFILIFGISNLSFATGFDSEGLTQIEVAKKDGGCQIIRPEEDKFKTSDNIIALTGKSPKGTTVTIELFGTTDLTRRKFSLNNLPSSKDYVRFYSKTFKVGPSGMFAEQLNLRLGVNKIKVTFRVTNSNKPRSEKIVYVIDTSQAKQTISNLFN
jgi:hypothetical protein